MLKRVLIVDDNDDFRKVVRQYLEMQNLDLVIQEAKSGELGIARALHTPPDVVLMDLRLPGINGIDAAIRIKDNAPGCDVIILTMFETEEFKKGYGKGNIAAFIGKSDIYDRLMPALKRCRRARLPPLKMEIL